MEVIEGKKLTWEEYQEVRERIKKAVIKDLHETNPETTILKVRTWCRDDEDRFHLCCYWDFSPYMEGLYKRFSPDVENFIKEEYEGLKRWNDSSHCHEELEAYYNGVYSEEGLLKKYYVTVTKYVETNEEMAILYSADFSLKGEVIEVNDPTGYYRGFDHSDEGYVLSETEQFILDYMYQAKYPKLKELPYREGDILYVDGSPYERPFYAVYCHDRYLYIEGVAELEIVKKYNLVHYRHDCPVYSLELKYRRELPLSYKITVVEKCDYQCLMEVSHLVKRYGDIDAKKMIQPYFEKEFENELVPAKSGSHAREILAVLEKIMEMYPERSFTDCIDCFETWLEKVKNVWIFSLDDKNLLEYLLEYFDGKPEIQDELRRKILKIREDFDNDWSDKVHFSEPIYFD